MAMARSRTLRGRPGFLARTSITIWALPWAITTTTVTRTSSFAARDGTPCITTTATGHSPTSPSNRALAASRPALSAWARRGSIMTTTVCWIWWSPTTQPGLRKPTGAATSVMSSITAARRFIRAPYTACITIWGTAVSRLQWRRLSGRLHRQRHRAELAVHQQGQRHVRGTGPATRRRL